ncbi:MAG: hypothetical protein KDA84_25580 [Planctomycetaceae bacterium]|nr:hypothetical protein [Planctomycetaceae bacterium]
MSVVNQKNLKVVLPRTGPDDFWQTITLQFAQADARKWKYLAMLALRVNAGWPLEQIAKVFQHQPGHVSRCLKRIKEELREHFDDSNFPMDEWIEDSG